MNLDERHIFGAHGNYRINHVDQPKNNTVVKLEEITKRYREYESDGQKFRMMFSKKLRRNIPLDTHLNKVSLIFQKGEYVNICGSYEKPRKALCDLVKGIVYPDFGHLWINGSVATVKAMRSAFRTHLSARENIRRMCALAQMDKEEIDLLIGRVLDFAEITAENAKLPMKKLKPQLARRIRCAYYLHAPYDILIMDEALPPTNERFIKKCDARIKEMVAGKSVCVIRTTAAPMSANSKLVTRVLLFGASKPVYDGKDAKEALKLYKKQEKKLIELEEEYETDSDGAFDDY